MKVSQFKQLVREEVKAIVKEFDGKAHDASVDDTVFAKNFYADIVKLLKKSPLNGWSPESYSVDVRNFGGSSKRYLSVDIEDAYDHGVDSKYIRLVKQLAKQPKYAAKLKFDNTDYDSIVFNLK